MPVTCECTNGANKGNPVEVNFPDDVLDIELDEPCPGCRWRKRINFELNPIYEQYIKDKVMPTSLSQEEGRAFLSYINAKQRMYELARRSDINSSENLQVTRYPNMDNKVACFVKFKNQGLFTL